MSAPEPTATVPVEEVKPTDATPVVETAAEPKVEESATVAEVAAPAVEAEATNAADVEPAITKEPSKEETKVVEGEVKESPPKSPNFLSKLLGSLKTDKSKGEKKVKAPKSPKKEKKKEEVEATAIEEAPKEAPIAEASEPVKEEATEPVKETESAAPVTEAPPVTEEVKEEKVASPKEKKALKVGRRLSARVGDLFKYNKAKLDVAGSSKVDEFPPKIDEHVLVAPLENPASEAVAKAEESAKPVETAAPVVAAAA